MSIVYLRAPQIFASLEAKTNEMIREKDIVVMKAVALCFKKYLKPEEAMIYCNLGRTQLAKKCDQLGIYKNPAGYYLREQLDHIFEFCSIQ